jgi:hypothetical protein
VREDAAYGLALGDDGEHAQPAVTLRALQDVSI